jgi:hypothetical protein
MHGIINKLEFQLDVIQLTKGSHIEHFLVLLHKFEILFFYLMHHICYSKPKN